MNLKRISENTIRCTVSAEEMDRYDIDLDDLLGHRDKAEDFLRQILDKAEEELDFHAHATDLNVQLSVLPKGDISMMISKGDSLSVGDMISHITDALDGLLDEKSRKALGEIVDRKKKSEESSDRSEKSERSDRNSKMPKDGLKHGKEAAKQKPEEVVDIDLTKKAPTEQEIALAREGEQIASQKTDLSEQLKRPLWAIFSSMDQIIRMVKMMEPDFEVPSQLYERDTVFYLRLNFESKMEEASQAVLLISEYADTIFAEDETAYTFKEHANVVLAKDAIKTLRQLQ